jgi:hypothetical protein
LIPASAAVRRPASTLIAQARGALPAAPVQADAPVLSVVVHPGRRRRDASTRVHPPGNGVRVRTMTARQAVHHRRRIQHREQSSIQ